MCFCREPLRLAGRLLLLRRAKRADNAAVSEGGCICRLQQQYLEATTVYFFPAIALRHALLHLPHSLDPGIAAGGVVVVVAIDRAAQGDTKRRARA